MPQNEACELRVAPPPPAGTQVPTRRFGRTEIQMPVITCGGMRAQYKWGDDTGMEVGGTISEECQANFDSIAERALELGINHYETARGYGCSEVQFCHTLSRLCDGKVDRADIIVQTKVPPMEDPEQFRTALQRSFDTLKPPGGYIDLFGFHGVNTEKHLDHIRNGCYAVAKEFQDAGKIKWIGFSTHAMTTTIINAIETDLFDYVNLHYHFIGSNTSTGTGALGGFYSNKLAIEAAEKHDMGMFIISPTDKGGQLYIPPAKFAKACEPLSPIEFNNLWLLSDPAIHTLVVGAARPSDFDEHVNSILKYDDRLSIVPPIETKLNQMLLETHGADFLGGWSKGVPDIWGNVGGAGATVDPAVNPNVVNIQAATWLWMLAKAWDFVGYGRYRYKMLEGNAKNWDPELSQAENIAKQEGSWNPGMPLPDGDLSVILAPLLQGSPHQEKLVESVTHTIPYHTIPPCYIMHECIVF